MTMRPQYTPPKVEALGSLDDVLHSRRSEEFKAVARQLDLERTRRKIAIWTDRAANCENGDDFLRITRDAEEAIVGFRKRLENR